jgi:hypothetical protein
MEIKMIIGKINKWRFSIVFNSLTLPGHRIYFYGFRFIGFEFYYTDLLGHITICNISFQWDKLFK